MPDLKTAALQIAARLQGAELRAARESRGLTHPQCAELCGVSLSVWRKWAYGYRQAPEWARERLCDEWGLDRGRMGLDPDRACPCCGQEYA